MSVAIVCDGCEARVIEMRASANMLYAKAENRGWVFGFHDFCKACDDKSKFDPAVEMARHTKSVLNNMSVQELWDVQRSALYPDEQALYDLDDFTPESGDNRKWFFEYTDGLIAKATGYDRYDTLPSAPGDC